MVQTILYVAFRITAGYVIEYISSDGEKEMDTLYQAYESKRQKETGTALIYELPEAETAETNDVDERLSYYTWNKTFEFQTLILH